MHIQGGKKKYLLWFQENGIVLFQDRFPCPKIYLKKGSFLLLCSGSCANIG